MGDGAGNSDCGHRASVVSITYRCVTGIAAVVKNPIPRTDSLVTVTGRHPALIACLGIGLRYVPQRMRPPHGMGNRRWQN